MTVAPANRTGGRLHWRALAPYLPAAALFVWLCIEGFARRVNPDEAAYKIIDVGIVHGQWPYRDLFINRQPMTFLWYLPMGLGASINAERVLAAAMMAASVPVVMRLAARWLSSERATPAGIVYALLLGNPLMPVLANTEAFILLPLTASLAVSSPYVAGALFAVAVMTKLHAAARRSRGRDGWALCTRARWLADARSRWCRSLRRATCFVRHPIAWCRAPTATARVRSRLVSREGVERREPSPATHSYLHRRSRLGWTAICQGLTPRVVVPRPDL